MGNKIVVFEEIKPGHRWPILYYIMTGNKVMFFRISRPVHDESWFNDLLARNKIEKIENGFNDIGFHGFYSDPVFDNIDKFFILLKNSRVISQMKNLYKADDIELVFKKILTEHLARFYYLNRIMGSVAFKFKDHRIMFVLSNGIRAYNTDGSDITYYIELYDLARKAGADMMNTDNIGFPVWAKILSYLNALLVRLNLFFKAAALFPWFGINRLRSGGGSKPSRNEYKYAIMIVSPLRQFANNIQKVDFLIDGDTIKKNEAIFLSQNRLSSGNKKYMADNKLTYLDDLDSYVSLKDIVKTLPGYFSLLLAFLFEKTFILESGLPSLYFYLRWKSLLRYIKVKNFITHSDFGIQSIARNILLSQTGCRTFYYMDSANSGAFYAKERQGNKYRHFCYGFLNYEYFISWSDKVSEYFQESHCRFKNYANLGCLWSEHLTLIENGVIKSELKNLLAKSGYKEGMKIISVFDSSFHDDSIATTYYDGLEFLKNIRKLVDDFPDAFFVLKEKKSRGYHKNMTFMCDEILSAYQSFEKHPRCFLPGTKLNTSELIAHSDLVISFPFTSTTFEALAHRKKAIWYDVADKFRNTFYDKMPGLVCHNYVELLDRVRSLAIMPGTDYSFFIDHYVKNEVEPYLDGKAITRFRHLLYDEYKKS